MCVVEKNTKKHPKVGFEGFLTKCGWLKSPRVVDMHWPPWVNGHGQGLLIGSTAMAKGC